MSTRGGSAMRLLGLVRKEFFQILRDPSSFGIAFVMPVFLLLLFGYGISLDAENVPIALVADQPTAETSGLFASFDHSKYFRPQVLSSMAQAEQALMGRSVSAVLHVQADFSRSVQEQTTAKVQIIVNGVDGNTARIIAGYAEAAINLWMAKRAQEQGLKNTTPVSLEHRIWFNPEVRSRNFLVPGILAVIMTMIGALLTAMVMAREWDRGTMEALMVTQVSIREILLGKLIPYFCLGMGSMTLSVVMAVYLFEVPLRGSLLVFTLASALFLITALGMGLFISILAKDQFVAGQAALLATFLPAFLLSGFIFDIGSMPPMVQTITHIVAARYFVSILQTVFLAGDVWSVIWPNALGLIILSAIFFGIARARARKRLD